MTQIFKASNATSFPTEAQEDVQKQLLVFSPQHWHRETRCGLTSDQVWHKRTPSPTEIRCALTHRGDSTTSGRGLSTKFHTGTVAAQHFRSCSSKKFPMPSTFSYWRTKFQTEVCSGSSYPAEAAPWIERSRDGHFSGRSQDVTIDV